MPTGISGLYKNTKGAKASQKKHHVKIFPEYFDAVENGTKTFEIRYNDRDYKVGDLLFLTEYRDGGYTGRATVREICYIINDTAYCKDGYVVLGLKPSGLVQKKKTYFRRKNKKNRRRWDGGRTY